MTVSQPPGPPSEAPPDIPPEIMAEAAVWVSRLHGPDRNRKMERMCLAWQAQSAVHSQAFEICTDGWELVGGITVRDVYAAAAARKQAQQVELSRSRRGWYWAGGMASLFALVGAVAGAWVWHQRGVYATEVGEQRSIVLEDGSRLSLNTSTRLRVDIEPGRRNVEVMAGEVFFEVAEDASRPFIAHVGGTDVVALGTSFVIRLDARARAEAMAVTLLSGRVSVQPSEDARVSYGAVAMEPGDRVRVNQGAATRQGAAAKIDRPSVEQVTAWKRSEIVFDGATLAEAVSELNRYHRSSIVLRGGPGVEGRRISGTFKTGELYNFAHAAAETHGLLLTERRDGWDLGPLK